MEGVFLTAGAMFLGFAVLAWIADRPVPQPRPDRRIAPDEMALTGEDYRDCIEDYFARRYREDER